MINGCDGLVIATPECYEPPAALEMLHQWFAKTSRKAHVVGTMMPTADRSGATEKKQSDKAQEIDEFIARIMVSHGPQSLVYVCSLFNNA